MALRRFQASSSDCCCMLFQRTIGIKGSHLLCLEESDQERGHIRHRAVTIPTLYLASGEQQQRVPADTRLDHCLVKPAVFAGWRGPKTVGELVHPARAPQYSDPSIQIAEQSMI